MVLSFKLNSIGSEWRVENLCFLAPQDNVTTVTQFTQWSNKDNYFMTENKDLVNVLTSQIIEQCQVNFRRFG